MNDNKETNWIEKLKDWHILLFIAVTILVLPLLLTIPVNWLFKNSFLQNLFDLSGKGEVGDTIGGITAPFINGLAAFLVFIAFKEQINANKIFKRQEEARNIFEQIKLIQDDNLEIEKTINVVIDSYTSYYKEKEKVTMANLNQVIYFTTEISLAIDLIEKYNGENKAFLYKKLFYLYVIKYQNWFIELEKIFKICLHNVNPDYELYVTELLFQIQYLNSVLIDVNKYKEELSGIEKLNRIYKDFNKSNIVKLKEFTHLKIASLIKNSLGEKRAALKKLQSKLENLDSFQDIFKLLDEVESLK